MFENSQSLDPFGIATGFAPGEDITGDVPTQAESDSLTQLLGLKTKTLSYLRDRHWTAQFNRLWLRGAQHLFYDRTGNNVIRQVGRRDLKDLPSIDNKLRPTHRAAVGKMFAELGHLEAVPRTTDREDIRTSVVIDSYLEYFDTITKSALKAIRAIGQIGTDGTSFIELEWDHFKGEKKASCKECEYVGEEEEIDAPCPLCMQEAIKATIQAQKVQAATDQITLTEGELLPEDPETELDPNAVPKLLEVRFGEPTLRCHRFEDIIVDPGADEVEDAQWIIIARPVPVNVARKRYPDMWQHINPTPELIHDRYLDMTVGEPELVERKLENHTVVYKYMEAPSGMFPNGRIIHFTEKRILEVKENYYYQMFRRMPIFVFRGDRNEGELYGQPWIDDAWHVQKERNKLLSQMRVARENTLFPRMIAEKGSGINLQTIKAHMQPILIDARTKHVPQYMGNFQMPAYVQMEPDRMAEAIREKAGVTPHEMGETKSKESGRYAALLEAQSTESLASIMFENREEWRELHKCAVVMAQELMDPEEVFVVTGNGRIKSQSWREANVMPGWDIRIVHNSGYSRNPVARRQEAQEDLQTGLFLDKKTGLNDMRKYAKAAGIDSMMFSNSTDDSERYYARELIAILEQGGQPIPQLWDNAEIIYSELTDWLRGEGRNAPPMLQAKVGALWLQYLQAVMSAGRPPDPDLMSQLPYQDLGGNAFQGATTQPAGEGGQAPPGSDGEANIQQADKTGENVANPGKQETGPKPPM